MLNRARIVVIQTGILRVLVGDISTLCLLPRNAYAPVPDDTVADPETNVFYPLYLTLDPLTGDIYWCESLGAIRRVMVLRTSGAVFRLCGNHDSASSVSHFNGVALNSPANPQGIVFDATDGSILYLDYPASLLRLLPNGLVVPVAILSYAPNIPTVTDGSFDVASALSLWYLTFSEDRQLLYTTDLGPGWSSVRVINIMNRTIYRVAGSFSSESTTPIQLAELSSHVPPLQTSFNNLYAVTLFGSGGNLLVVDGGAGLVHTVILNPSEATFCPAGYSCPCGTPIPCTSPAQFCPVNEPLPRNVARGFYATGASSLRSSDGSSLFTSSAPCPMGSYCTNGTRFLCWPGTFGVAEYQATPKGCVPCPSGTYSSTFGAVGSRTCISCPAGTYSDLAGSAFCTFCPVGTSSSALGANSLLSCAPCGASFANNCSVDSMSTCVNASTSAAMLSSSYFRTSLPGSSACFSMGNARIAVSASTASLQDIVITSNSSSNDRTTGTDSLLVAVCLPLAILAAIPTMHLVVTRGCAESSKKRERCRAALWCVYCCLRARRRAQVCLRAVDIYALRHYTTDGAAPVKQRTSVGGATTLLAAGCVACLAAVLVVQFVRSNSLRTTALLPAPLPTLQQYAPLRPFSLSKASRSPLAPATLVEGLELRVSVMGPACSVPLSVEFSELISGVFVSSVVDIDPTTAFFTHLFSCPKCAFGPMSSLNITFAADCQAFAVAASSVGATGNVYVASFVGTSPSIVTSASEPGLAGFSVLLQPQLEVVENRITGVSSRGYSVVVASSSLIETRAASSPSPVTSLFFSWATNSAFVYTEVVPITSLSQLASSIIGLLGLLGGFGIVFSVFERACPKPVPHHGGHNAALQGQRGRSFRVPILSQHSQSEFQVTAPSNALGSADVSASSASVLGCQAGPPGTSRQEGSAAAVDTSMGRDVNSTDSSLSRTPRSVVHLPLVGGLNDATAGRMTSTGYNSRMGSAGSRASSHGYDRDEQPELSIHNPLRVRRQ
jgi:hypothetical protein